MEHAPRDAQCWRHPSHTRCSHPASAESLQEAPPTVSRAPPAVPLAPSTLWCGHCGEAHTQTAREGLPASGSREASESATWGPHLPPRRTRNPRPGAAGVREKLAFKPGPEAREPPQQCARRREGHVSMGPKASASSFGTAGRLGCVSPVIIW